MSEQPNFEKAANLGAYLVCVRELLGRRPDHEPRVAGLLLSLLSQPQVDSL